MFFFFIFIVMAGIVGAAVWVGLHETKKKDQRNSPRARSREDKVNMAKIAGVFPNRKEN